MTFCLIHGNISLVSCQETHIPRLITPAEKGRDLEPRVIDTYIVQSQAEAQEGKTCFSLQYRSLVCVCVCDGSCVCVFLVTIARAIELKHNASLIAALAFETANFYQKAGRFTTATV